MRRYVAPSFALFALLCSALVFGSGLTLTWTPPVGYVVPPGPPLFTVGTIITYKVYGALPGQPKLFLEAVTTNRNVRPNVDPGLHCYVVSAVVLTIESAMSDELCAAPVLAPLVPAKPTNFVITAMNVASDTLAVVAPL